jgi:hypothetical protein
MTQTSDPVAQTEGYEMKTYNLNGREQARDAAVRLAASAGAVRRQRIGGAL